MRSVSVLLVLLTLGCATPRPIILASAPAAEHCDAIEFELTSGVTLRVSAAGEVTELRGKEEHGVAISNAARDEIRHVFANARWPMVLFQSMMMPDMQERVIRLRHDGSWESGPTYRPCAPSADPNYLSSSTNELIDRLVTLAGYRDAFPCQPGKYWH
jgi:hypothetical protein